MSLLVALAQGSGESVRRSNVTVSAAQVSALAF